MNPSPSYSIFLSRLLIYAEVPRDGVDNQAAWSVGLAVRKAVRWGWGLHTLRLENRLAVDRGHDVLRGGVNLAAPHEAVLPLAFAFFFRDDDAHRLPQDTGLLCNYYVIAV
jgi:hypothetical protein